MAFSTDSHLVSSGRQSGQSDPKSSANNYSSSHISSFTIRHKNKHLLSSSLNSFGLWFHGRDESPLHSGHQTQTACLWEAAPVQRTRKSSDATGQAGISTLRRRRRGFLLGESAHPNTSVCQQCRLDDVTGPTSEDGAAIETSQEAPIRAEAAPHVSALSRTRVSHHPDVLLTFPLTDSHGIEWTEPAPLASRVYANPSCIRRRMPPLKSLQWFSGRVERDYGSRALRYGLRRGGVSNGWPRWATVSGCCDRWCRRSPCRSRT